MMDLNIGQPDFKALLFFAFTPLFWVVREATERSLWVQKWRKEKKLNQLRGLAPQVVN